MLLPALLFLFKNTISQNLIRNGSFEGYTLPIDCNGSFEIPGSPTFHHVVDDWYTYQSPDYFHSVCAPGGYNVPNSWFGYCNSKTGNAYAGIGVFDIRFNYQEYIYQTLSIPLKQDSIYCLSFFVSRADNFPYAVKQIGAYFSNTPPSLSSGYINAIPQVENQSNIITDTVNWIEIQGCFIAHGGEQYVTLGNFNDNTNIDTLRIQPNTPLTGVGTDVAYYYIDSITLWQNNFPTAIKEGAKSEGASVYPNPARDILTIKVTGKSTSKNNYGIKIVDILGKEIINEIYKEQIDISFLEKGIYFLSIFESGNLISTKKIVKE